MKTIAEQIKWDFKTNGDLQIRDKRGKLIYFEYSDGWWAKYERDSQGNIVFYENSSGEMEDNLPKPCENKIVEIDGIKYKLTKV